MTSKTAVVYASVHHGNTRQIAETLAAELSADLFTAADAVAMDAGHYDLVGVGSGVYFGRHHSSVRRLVESWRQPPKRAFLFSTAGLPFLRYFQHASLRRKLQQQGCEIVGEFCCRGWDTVGPLWLMGGINRKRPNAIDLKRARQFAAELNLTLSSPTQSLPESRQNTTS